MGEKTDFHKLPWLFFSEERRGRVGNGGPQLCSEIRIHAPAAFRTVKKDGTIRRREVLPVNPAADGLTRLINRDLHRGGL